MTTTTLPEPTYDQTAPRSDVSLSLNEDLLRQAKALTRNLSGTIEGLLADYVTAEQARKREDDAKLDQVIDALNEFHERHGFLSDEFSTL